METTLSIAAFAVSLLSSAFALYTFIWTRQRDRKQATLEAYNRLQEQVLDDLNHYMPKDMEEIAKNPRSEAYRRVSTYLARIEHFCVGVNQKIYDRGIVYELAHGYLDGAIKSRITPLIEKKNRSGHDYYANIHWVYAWMETEQKKRDGAGR